MRRSLPVLAFASLLAALGGCAKSRAAAAEGKGPPAPSPGAACAHTACGERFYVDAVSPESCTSGAECDVALKLVALAPFHINDEYPYRFRGDDSSLLQFLGTDAAGKNVFSKAAGDWRKADATNGSMNVRFVPTVKGSTTVGGTFKLSVCSTESCLLEQRQVAISVAVR
jgi:hypothetical protein